MATGGSSLYVETPLHRAVWSGNIIEIRKLIIFGADLGARGSDGRTPLMSAVVVGQEGAAEVLVKAMTDSELSVVDSDGYTVLHLMAMCDCLWSQVIRDIVNTCPTVLLQRDRHGHRPLDTARSYLPRTQVLYDILEPMTTQQQQQQLQQQLQQQQQYTEGIASNEEQPCNITITVVGHHGVGKSCFVRQLKQEYIPEGGPGSTDTADLYVNYLGYNPNTGLRQKLEEDGEIKTCRQRLKYIIDQKDQTYTKSSEITPQQLDDKSAVAFSTMDTSESAKEKIGFKQKLKMLFSKSKTKEEKKIDEISSKTPPRLKGISDEQRSVIRDVLGTRMDDWDDFELKGHVTIYDFGGEKVFYNTQHCFMSSNMVFVLVFDVAMCLDSRTANDGYEIIEFWLKVFATYAIDEAAQGKGTPPVILLGSHMDLVSSDTEEHEVKFISVLENLYEKPEIRRIIESHVRGIFPVANLNDCTKNQHTYEQIWEKIIEIAPLQSQWKKPVPARWVALEYELVRLKNAGKIILTYEELIEINQTSAVPLAKHDITHFLRRLRFSGSFLCFDLHSTRPFIVLQPQWIIDAFKAIITDPKFTSNLPPTQIAQWRQYNESGVLSQDLIRQLWGRHANYRFLDEEEKLIIAMETLGLLTKPISVDAVIDYFIVPSVLQTADPEIIRPVLDDPDTVTTVTVCAKFDNPFVPQAIWDKMIASCIHRFQRLTELGQDGLTFIRRGFACLSVDCLWNMIINCNDNAMKVTMFKKDTFESIPTGMGTNLLQVLEFLLQRILELNHQSHLRYQFYLHNDYRFGADEKMVNVEDLRQTPRLQCCGSKGSRWIDKDDLSIWFGHPDQKTKRAGMRHDEVTQALPDRNLSFKEVGRVSRYIGSTYLMFFVELDCPVVLVEQEMEEHRHLAFRSRIAKIFIHLLKTKTDTRFPAIAAAMSRHGMNPSMLVNILDTNRNMLSIDETLSDELLNRCLSANDVPIIANHVDIKSYFNLFLELGFTPRKIDEFDDQYRNKTTPEKISALLEAFIKETNPLPTLNSILLAMQECDMDTESLIKTIMPS